MANRVVVLGAGFGGLELATVLSEALGDDVAVTLIDKNDAFVFGYSKLDVMFGRTSMAAVRLPYHDIAKPGVRFLQETLASSSRTRVSTRPTTWSLHSVPITTSTPRRGSPKEAASSIPRPVQSDWP